ncbi:hypothetical protein Tco_0921207, partial [Tanacetum coccineum]
VRETQPSGKGYKETRMGSTKGKCSSKSQSDQYDTDMAKDEETTDRRPRRGLDEDQLVVIGGGFSEVCKGQLKELSKENMDNYSWQSTSIHNITKLRIQAHSSKSSSSKLFPNVFPTLNKTNTSLLELELLFSPMYEVYFNEGNKGVSKSFALSDNLQQQDTQSTFNVRLTLELIIPPTDVNAKENNTDQAIDA